MTAITDLLQDVIFFGDTEIYMIWDINEKKNDAMPWFKANDVSKSLGYNKKNIDIVTKRLVYDEDKKTFNELKHLVSEKPKNMQSNTIFINEYGLYSLVLSSRLKKAAEIRSWLVREVMPAIRKTGIYKMREKDKKRIECLNKKIKELRKENSTLKNNQKGKNYNKRGIVYILRPSNDSRYKKIGYTYNIGQRLDNYNTSVPDDMILLYEFETDDPKAMELCMKSRMTRLIYRGKKEYYEISLKKIKNIIDECENFVKNNKYNNAREELSRISIGYDTDDMIVYVDINQLQSQSGGTVVTDLYDKHIYTDIDIDIDNIEDDCDDIYYDNYHKLNAITTIKSGIDFDFYSDEEMNKFSSDIITNRLNQIDQRKNPYQNGGSERNIESELQYNFNYLYGDIKQNNIDFQLENNFNNLYGGSRDIFQNHQNIIDFQTQYPQLLEDFDRLRK